MSMQCERLSSHEINMACAYAAVTVWFVLTATSVNRRRFHSTGTLIYGGDVVMAAQKLFLRRYRSSSAMISVSTVEGKGQNIIEGTGLSIHLEENSNREHIMSAVHHLDGMGNVKWPHIDRHTLLVFIFITHICALIHTHISSCSLWLMRPRAGDGSIKELPPSFFLSLSNTHTLSPLSNMHLIDSSDLTEKREMGNWKMVEEDWKQRADYKLCEGNKRPSLCLFS